MIDPKDPRDPDDDEEDLQTGDEEDAGQDDVESGDDTETGQEPSEAKAEDGEVAPRAARATARQDNYREIARQEAEHRARVEREIADLRQQLQARQPQEESEEQFEARLQLLPVDDRVRERLGRSEKRHQRELLYTRLQSADAADRASYQSRAAVDTRYRKYEQQVEQILATERRQGRDFPRDTILKFILGEKVMANAAKINEARKQGKQRIDRQQAKPIEGRSDRQVQRRGRLGEGNSIEDLEYRLTQPGVFI